MRKRNTQARSLLNYCVAWNLSLGNLHLCAYEALTVLIVVRSNLISIPFFILLKLLNNSSAVF